MLNLRMKVVFKTGINTVTVQVNENERLWDIINLYKRMYDSADSVTYQFYPLAFCKVISLK